MPLDSLTLQKKKDRNSTSIGKWIDNDKITEPGSDNERAGISSAFAMRMSAFFGMPAKDWGG